MSEEVAEQYSVLAENWTDEEFWYASLHFGQITVRVQGRIVDEENRIAQATDLSIALQNFEPAFWQLVKYQQGSEDE